MDKSLEVLERLLQASIKEQRAARRWKILFRTVTLGLFAYFILSGPSPLEGENITGDSWTAIVRVKGVIADGELASAENIKKGLNRAFEQDKTKAVILEINSPGGSPVQAGQVYDEIKRLRSLHPEAKLYAVITDLGASGGYYIASAADEIFADKASLVGSIGVTAASFGYVELMRKVGVERRAYTSGEHKAFLDQFQPENEAETEFWKAVLQNTHHQFIAAVQVGRGDRLQATNHPELFSGLIWTGEQALRMGLVDKLGDADFVAREVVGESRVVDYTRKGSALDRFANKLGTSLVKELGIQLGIMGSPELR